MNYLYPAIRLLNKIHTCACKVMRCMHATELRLSRLPVKTICSDYKDKQGWTKLYSNSRDRRNKKKTTKKVKNGSDNRPTPSRRRVTRPGPRRKITIWAFVSVIATMCFMWLYITGRTSPPANVFEGRGGSSVVDEEPKVPAFYVYDEIPWMDIKCVNNATMYDTQRRMYKVKGKGNASLSVTELLQTDWSKHSDDYWFYKHALEHPARVRSPELADVFVVGGLLNLIVEQPAWSFMSCCVGSVCDFDLVSEVEKMLLNSTWFTRSQGRDHVMVASHYASWLYERHLGRFRLTRKYNVNLEAIPSCNWISYERNGFVNGRLRLASTYVGRGCTPTTKTKTRDVAFIGTMPENAEYRRYRPWMEARYDACRWLKEEESKANGAFNVSTCGQGKQCPALAEARMGLHVRGDSWSSQRLMDTLLSGTVPVMTSQEQFDVLPPILPWRRMTVFASLYSSKQHFIDALRKAPVSTVDTFNAENRIAYKVDWRNSFLFERYMQAFSIMSSRPTWRESLLRISSSFCWPVRCLFRL